MEGEAPLLGQRVYLFGELAALSLCVSSLVGGFIPKTDSQQRFYSSTISTCLVWDEFSDASADVALFPECASL